MEKTQEFKLYSNVYTIEPYVSKLVTHKNEEFVIVNVIDEYGINAYSISDPDKLTFKIERREIKKIIADKINNPETDIKPVSQVINNIRKKYIEEIHDEVVTEKINPLEKEFNDLYDTESTKNKEDLTYCTMSGNYELSINFALDSIIQDLGNISISFIKLPKKNINVKMCSAHYVINNELDYISFALCCRKIYNKYPNLKTVIAIPDKSNIQIINKIIEKEFNNHEVKIILYEGTNTN
jgi:hypothetical protein